MKKIIFVLLVTLVLCGCDLQFANHNFEVEVLGAGTATITYQKNQSGYFPHTWLNEPLPFYWNQWTSMLNYSVSVISVNAVTLNIYYDDALIYTETGINPSYN